jgi:hypothetical protein
MERGLPPVINEDTYEIGQVILDANVRRHSTGPLTPFKQPEHKLSQV